MTRRTALAALLLSSCLVAAPAWAQSFKPNDAGVTMGHWHLNSANIEATKKMFVAMGGTATDGPLTRVTFPGVVVILNLPAGAAPATAGTAGSVVNHVGFMVKSIPDSIAKWNAGGVPVVQGNGTNNRADQAYVTTADGLRIEILEDKNQAMPIRHEHVHFAMPESEMAKSVAWYGKIFGAKPGADNRMVADIPGVQLRYLKTDAALPTTKGRVLDHIGFDISDLTAFAKKLEANGVKLDRPITTQPNGAKLAFITDPWGTYIELNERPGAVYLP